MEPLPSVTRLWNTSWGFYTAHWKKIVQLALVPGAIIAAVCVCLLIAAVTSPLLAILGFFGLLAFIVYIISYAVSLIQFAATGQELPIKQMYSQSMEFFWQFIWVGILAGIASAGGLLLFIIPGIIVSLRLLLSRVVLVVEKRKGISALARSWALVKGSTGAVIWRCVGLALIMIVIYIPQIIFSLLLPKSSAALAGIGIVYGVLQFFILVPVSIFYLYFIYDSLSKKSITPEAEADARKKVKIFMWLAPALIIVFIVLLAVVSVAGHRP